MSKPTILTFSPHYLPGFKAGGPVRSLASIVDHLGDEFNFKILTLNHDLADLKVYSTIKEDEWNQVGKASIFYLDKKHLSIKNLKRILEIDYDVIYFNSFFHPLFTIKPLFYLWLGIFKKKSIIIAPRGEFSEGALGLKLIKKKMYILLFKITGFANKIIWQASSTYEENDIKNIFKNDVKVIISPNLPPKIPHSSNESTPKKKDHLNIVFISRIDRKKNLLGALEILKKVKSSVAFDIYGPQEDMEYWSVCESAINNLPKNIHAEYKGILKPEQIVITLSHYDLFFFPTLGENFGHVIFEALFAGVPVLLSDQTPWNNLERSHAGFNISLKQEDAFVSKIEMLAGLPDDAYVKWRQGAKDTANNFINDSSIIKQNKMLFMEAINDNK